MIGITSALSGSPSKELLESLCENSEQAEAIYNAVIAKTEAAGNGECPDHSLPL